MVNEMLNLRDMTVDDLKDFCISIGEKSYRAGQIFRWLYKDISAIDDMTDLPVALREKLKGKSYIGNIGIEKKYESNIDETTKYLLKLEDDNIIESVLMEYSFGLSACLSTQVGCAMGCSFCASTIGGLVRSLTAGEMAEEIITMQKDRKSRISNIVLMGSGEPLKNYDNVVKFLKIINSEDGLNIGLRHVTLSTCGIVPEIKRLADLKLQITLAISLHAPNDAIRRGIMPAARVYSINELLEACRYYIEKTGRRVTFEYSLIKGVNDSVDNARELTELLRGMLCHVNLIPVNEISEREYKKSDNKRVVEFKNILEKRGIEATVRRELGADINAACGQLRKSYIGEKK
jgi:23S rRNA m2A2503 methyltransferase